MWCHLGLTRRRGWGRGEEEESSSGPLATTGVTSLLVPGGKWDHENARALWRIRFVRYIRMACPMISSPRPEGRARAAASLADCGGLNPHFQISPINNWPEMTSLMTKLTGTAQQNSRGISSSPRSYQIKEFWHVKSKSFSPDNECHCRLSIVVGSQLALTECPVTRVGQNINRSSLRLRGSKSALFSQLLSPSLTLK